MALLGTDSGVNYVIAAQDVSQAAIDSAKAGLQNLSTTTDRMTANMKARMTSLKKNWLAVTAAIAGAYLIIQKAWNLAEQSAKYEQSYQAFRTMAEKMGHDADALFGRLRELSGGLIDKSSLVEATNRAISLGIPIEKLGDLMIIARAKARDMGITTAQAFNDIATGVGRASPLILDNLGLVMKVGSANEKMAASLGKTVAELTDQEKKMAVLNATLEAGKEALARHNLEVSTTNEKMQRLKATIADIQLMLGTGIIRATAGAAGAFQWLSAGALKLSGGLFKLIQGFATLMSFTMIGDKEMWTSMAEGYRMNAEAAFAASQELTGKAMDNFEAMMAKSTDIQTAMILNKQQATQQAREEEIAREEEVYDWTKQRFQEIQELQLNHFAVLAEFEEQYNRNKDRLIKQRLADEKNAAVLEKDIRSQVVSNAISLLFMLGTKQKEFAILAIAITTAMEMTRAWQATQTAAMLAYSSQLIPGDPTSIFRAQAAYAYTMQLGALNVALIAAAGVMRAITAYSGGPSATGETSGYSPTSPVETIASSQTETEEKESERPLSITIHNYGVIGADMDHVARELVPAIRKAQADGV